MNREIFSYLKIAGDIAIHGSARNYYLGAVGVRQDGALVRSCNGATPIPNLTLHAEYRLCRKLGFGGTVYVARINKNGSFCMARPCRGCQMVLRKHGVKRAYYSISDNEFGCLVINS